MNKTITKYLCFLLISNNLFKLQLSINNQKCISPFIAYSGVISSSYLYVKYGGWSNFWNAIFMLYFNKESLIFKELYFHFILQHF